MLWDLFQQSQIADIQDRIDKDTSSASSRIAEIEDRLDRLALVHTAMFELMCERLKITPDDIARKIQQVDLRDGVADGKLGSIPAQPCRSCKRPISRKHARCLYCGTSAM